MFFFFNSLNSRFLFKSLVAERVLDEKSNKKITITIGNSKKCLYVIAILLSWKKLTFNQKKVAKL